MLQKIENMPNAELLLNTALQSFVMSDDGRDIRGVRVIHQNNQEEETFLCCRGLAVTNIVLVAERFAVIVAVACTVDDNDNLLTTLLFASDDYED